MKKIIAIICVLALSLTFFAACSKKDNSQSTVTSELTTQKPLKKVPFPTGTFVNDEVKFTFNDDGSGEFSDRDSETGVPIKYTENEDSNTLNVSFGAPDDTQEVSYEVPDENTLILRYSNNNYTLTRVDENDDNDDDDIKKDNTSIVGNWSDGSVAYTFNKDGSGEIFDYSTKTGTPFEYELKGDNNITLHIGSADDNSKATYSVSGSNLTLKYADGKSYNLSAG